MTEISEIKEDVRDNRERLFQVIDEICQDTKKCEQDKKGFILILGKVIEHKGTEKGSISTEIKLINGQVSVIDGLVLCDNMQKKLMTAAADIVKAAAKNMRSNKGKD